MKTDNELIAEFMGLTYHENSNEWTHNGSVCWIDQTPPDYGILWDWLMPVVERIGNVWDLNEIGTEAEKVLKLPVSSHIQQVYKAVVEFIKWYNQQE